MKHGLRDKAGRLCHINLPMLVMCKVYVHASFVLQIDIIAVTFCPMIGLYLVKMFALSFLQIFSSAVSDGFFFLLMPFSFVFLEFSSDFRVLPNFCFLKALTKNFGYFCFRLYCAWVAGGGGVSVHGMVGGLNPARGASSHSAEVMGIRLLLELKKERCFGGMLTALPSVPRRLVKGNMDSCTIFVICLHGVICWLPLS